MRSAVKPDSLASIESVVVSEVRSWYGGAGIENEAVSALELERVHRLDGCCTYLSRTPA